MASLDASARACSTQYYVRGVPNFRAGARSSSLRHLRRTSSREGGHRSSARKAGRSSPRPELPTEPGPKFRHAPRSPDLISEAAAAREQHGDEAQERHKADKVDRLGGHRPFALRPEGSAPCADGRESAHALRWMCACHGAITRACPSDIHGVFGTPEAQFSRRGRRSDTMASSPRKRRGGITFSPAPSRDRRSGTDSRRRAPRRQSRRRSLARRIPSRGAVAAR